MGCGIIAECPPRSTGSSRGLPCLGPTTVSRLGGLNGPEQPSIIRPVIPDLNIYRTANILVRQHGNDAPIQAAMRADAMLAKGDAGGYAVWKRVLKAVEELGRSAANPSTWRGARPICDNAVITTHRMKI